MKDIEKLPFFTSNIFAVYCLIYILWFNSPFIVWLASFEKMHLGDYVVYYFHPLNLVNISLFNYPLFCSYLPTRWLT